MDDWQKHLDKLDRREKLAKKIARLFVLCLFLGFGLWSVVNIWPYKPKPIAVEGQVCYDDNVLKIYDGNSWNNAASEIRTNWDAIQITSSAGGIEITSTGTSADAIEIDASTDDGNDDLIITGNDG